jgi:hypothetical protein
VSRDFDMTLGAIAAIILDYAAVAFVFGLLVLDRWLGIRRGITLDTLLMLIVALGTMAWFAGCRLRQRMLGDASARTDITQLRGPAALGRKEAVGIEAETDRKPEG